LVFVPVVLFYMLKSLYLTKIKKNVLEKDKVNELDLSSILNPLHIKQIANKDEFIFHASYFGLEFEYHLTQVNQASLEEIILSKCIESVQNIQPVIVKYSDKADSYGYGVVFTCDTHGSEGQVVIKRNSFLTTSKEIYDNIIKENPNSSLNVIVNDSPTKKRLEILTNICKKQSVVNQMHNSFSKGIKHK
jgi:hypothetical protein